MSEYASIIQGAIMWICGIALAVIALGGLAWLTRDAWRCVRHALSTSELVAVALVACVCTYAAQKRLVRYLSVDTQTYLRDNGSYVDSETGVVHIDFTRVVVPDAAVVYVDRVQRGDDEAEFENVFAQTLGELTVPFEIESDNATNYLWYVYTDWTPGPTVQTNGVWRANWGRDTSGSFIIPVRTIIRTVDDDGAGEIIAPPNMAGDENNKEHE